jgi:hypothetical protein
MQLSAELTNAGMKKYRESTTYAGKMIELADRSNYRANGIVIEYGHKKTQDGLSGGASAAVVPGVGVGIHVSTEATGTASVKKSYYPHKLKP